MKSAATIQAPSDTSESDAEPDNGDTTKLNTASDDKEVSKEKKDVNDTKLQSKSAKTHKTQRNYGAKEKETDVTKNRTDNRVEKDPDAVNKSWATGSESSGGDSGHEGSGVEELGHKDTPERSDLDGEDELLKPGDGEGVEDGADIADDLLELIGKLLI